MVTYEHIEIRLRRSSVLSVRLRLLLVNLMNKQKGHSWSANP